MNENFYEEEEKIYPHIYPKVEMGEYKTLPLAPFSSINPEINPGINPTNRISEFLLEKKKLEEKLQHYTKIKSRWTKADSCIKIACVSLAGCLTIATSVIGELTPAILGASAGIISGALGGVGAVQLFLGEGISIGINSKKKKIYREICEQMELGINKLYLFQVRALQDKILITEEIEECQRIITEINGKIEGVKEDKKRKKI